MKKIFIVVGFLVFNDTAAFAQLRTCQQIAAACISAGGTQATCFEPSRLANCERTGQYVAPVGKVYPAQKKK